MLDVYRSYRWRLATVALVSAIEGIAIVLIAALLPFLIEGAIGERSREWVWLYFGLGAVALGAEWSCSRLAIHTNKAVFEQLVLRVVAHVQVAMDRTFQPSREDVMLAVNHHLGKLTMSTVNSGRQLVQNVVQFVSTLFVPLILSAGSGMLLSSSIALVGLMLGPTLLGIALGCWLTRREKPLLQLEHRVRANGLAVFERITYANLDLLRVFGADARITRAMRPVAEEQASHASQRQSHRLFQWTFTNIASWLGVVLPVLFVANGWTDATFSTLASVVTLNLALRSPMLSIPTVIAQLQEAWDAARHISNILDASPARADSPNAEPLELPDGKLMVECNDLIYRFEGDAHNDDPTRDAAQTAKDCRDEVDTERMSIDYLCIPESGIVAIIGESGIGKSTLARLLLGLAEPHQGRILLNGVDRNAYTFASRARGFAYVSQERDLDGVSIAEMLRIGAPQATDDELQQVLEQVRFRHHAIAAGTDLDAPLTGVSGGERTRLALAAAILSDARIFVLDEPTTGLDATTAESILHVLSELAHDRTIVLITHDAKAVQMLASDIVELVRDPDLPSKVTLRRVDR